MSQSCTFCILPWVHLNVHPNGDITPCCNADLNSPIANEKEGDLKTILNNESFKRIRLDMLAGKQVPECERCYRFEAAGKLSQRQVHNELLKDCIPVSEKTLPDGSLEDLSLVYLDLRFSNICNFKCRGCFPGSSSSWTEDYELLTQTKVTKKLNNMHSPLVKEILDNLANIKKIYIVGGEPLIMQENYQLLERLIAIERTEIILTYSTNLSQLSFGNYNVLEYWNKFHNIILMVSIDDLYERGEYFRKGLNFQTFLANWKKVEEECPLVIMSVVITVNIMNIFKLDEIVEFLIVELGVSELKIQFNLLTSPAELSIQMLTDNFKNEIKENLENYQANMGQRLHEIMRQNSIKHLEKRIEYISSLERTAGISKQLYNLSLEKKSIKAGGGTPLLTNIFDPIIQYMMDGPGEARLSDFFNRTDKLDKIRGEDYRKLFPELVRLRDATKG
jgi:MoaA/NifB/PqqE/SkfB family radical SAM enzyme